MPPLSAEDVVRLIATECRVEDARGVGIRIAKAAALVEAYAEQKVRAFAKLASQRPAEVSHTHRAENEAVPR